MCVCVQLVSKYIVYMGRTDVMAHTKQLLLSILVSNPKKSKSIGAVCPSFVG